MQRKTTIGSILLTCVFIFSLFIIPAKAQITKVAGYYASYSQLGSIGIQLNSDFTFRYRYMAEYGNDRATGTYKINHDTILLTFKQSPHHCDTMYYTEDTIYQTVGSSDSGGFHLIAINHPITVGRCQLQYYVDYRDSEFYFNHQKLFLFDRDSTGKIIPMIWTGNSKFRKYLLFGKHYPVTRRCYIRRHRDPGEMFDER